MRHTLNHHTLKQIWSSIIGTQEEYSLEHRVLNGTLFMLVLFLFTTNVNNIVLRLGIGAIGSSLAGFVAICGLYYLARAKGHYSYSAKKMNDLIESLLSFSRMGRRKLKKTHVDLNFLVQEIVSQFKSETKGRTINWHISDLPSVSADYILLGSALTNLISNAIKFTSSREQAEIEIGCRELEAETIFYIRDNGVGFDQQYAANLFGYFQRLHRTEEYEGTGIGLANVRRIIEMHKGKTWAKGTIDHGAEFYFSLPTS